jgi:arylsulfatase A-like enzyme
MISRRTFLGAAASTALARQETPNVILIISDDHGWTDYGFMGHKDVRTPHIDRIAAEGLTFTRGYVPTSLCRPSLASMMTGLYPHQHRITGNDPNGNARDAENRARMVKVFQESRTIAGLLAKRGYPSHQSGKWWEGECKCGGFTECMTHGDVAKGGRHGDEGLKIGRQTMEPVFDFIDRSKGKPFFLWYAPFLPHTPHNPPERLLSKYTVRDLPPDVAKYYANIEWLDETVGELLQHIEKRRLSEDTLIIYLADNGWIQKGSPQPFESRSKLSPYDAGVRTPILLHWPGRIKPVKDENTLASSVDLASTVLPACGIKAVPPMAGTNLLDANARARRSSIFGSIFVHTSIDVERPSANVKYRWMVKDRWKLIVPHLPNRNLEIWEKVGRLSWMRDTAELFDIVADPTEKKDLATARPEVVKQLTAELDRWWKPA